MTHEKNMKYLKSAQELYLEVCKKIKGNVDSIKAYEGYFEALDLLYQQPMLGDFVATNEDGEVMEKPETLYISTAQPPSEHESFQHDKKWKEYQEALDRRLWEGWEVTGSCNMTITIINSEMQLVSFHVISKQCKVKETVKSNYNELITSGVKLERIQKK